MARLLLRGQGAQRCVACGHLGDSHSGDYLFCREGNCMCYGFVGEGGRLGEPRVVTERGEARFYCVCGTRWFWGEGATDTCEACGREWEIIEAGTIVLLAGPEFSYKVKGD